MSGNNISIISLMMLFMMILNPIKSLFNVNNEFSRYQTQLNDRNDHDGTDGDATIGLISQLSRNLLLPKLLFIGINTICVAIGIYKFNSLGLLPTQSHLPPALSVPAVKLHVCARIMKIAILFGDTRYDA